MKKSVIVKSETEQMIDCVATKCVLLKTQLANSLCSKACSIFRGVKIDVLEHVEQQKSYFFLYI